MATNSMGPARLLRLRDVVERVGLSRSTVYARVAEGTFPRPIALGGRRVAWVEEEIKGWIDSQIAASRQNAGVA